MAHQPFEPEIISATPSAFEKAREAPAEPFVRRRVFPALLANLRRSEKINVSAPASRL
jgi:hypothetical protein